MPKPKKNERHITSAGLLSVLFTAIIGALAFLFVDMAKNWYNFEQISLQKKRLNLLVESPFNEIGLILDRHQSYLEKLDLEVKLREKLPSGEIERIRADKSDRLSTNPYPRPSGIIDNSLSEARTITKAESADLVQQNKSSSWNEFLKVTLLLLAALILPVAAAFYWRLKNEIKRLRTSHDELLKRISELELKSSLLMNRLRSADHRVDRRLKKTG